MVWRGRIWGIGRFAVRKRWESQGRWIWENRRVDGTGRRVSGRWIREEVVERAVGRRRMRMRGVSIRDSIVGEGGLMKVRMIRSTTIDLNV